MIAVFVVQVLGDRFTGGGVTRLLGLSRGGLSHGFIWQIVTYIFVHGGLFHLLLNGLVLFFMGPATERAIGSRQFYLLFFLSGVLGGLGWLLISGYPRAVCIGASGAVFGVIGAFAALFPHRPITLLLFFVIPITMKAWVLAVLLGGMELLFLLGAGEGGIAYAAHLAGGLAGYVYAWVVFKRGDVGSLFRKPRVPPGWRVFHGGGASVDGGELDRILDKIARGGMSSLSGGERKALEKASRERRR